MKGLNFVTLVGTVAADPEVRQFSESTRNLRVLVTVRTDEPRRRVDVIPVVMWNHDDNLANALTPGTPVVVTARIERRFWESADGRRSRLEVVASAITVAGLVYQTEPVVA